jgi:hypothetical protein
MSLFSGTVARTQKTVCEHRVRIGSGDPTVRRAARLLLDRRASSDDLGVVADVRRDPLLEEREEQGPPSVPAPGKGGLPVI